MTNNELYEELEAMGRFDLEECAFDIYGIDCVENYSSSELIEMIMDQLEKPE